MPASGPALPITEDDRDQSPSNRRAPRGARIRPARCHQTHRVVDAAVETAMARCRSTHPRRALQTGPASPNKHGGSSNMAGPDIKTFTREFGGKTLTIEHGRVAGLAGGAVMVRYGDTVVLCTATMARTPREGMDFFPLTVDFEERMYAAGKIPGSLLPARGPAHDRGDPERASDRPPAAPALPEGHAQRRAGRHHGACPPTRRTTRTCCGTSAASAALSISDIPFAGPVGGGARGLHRRRVRHQPDVRSRSKRAGSTSWSPARRTRS